MRNKSFLKLLQYDLNIGFSINLPKYIISALFIAILCAKFYSNLSASEGIPNGNIIDCYMYIFKGMKVYNAENGDPFMIPFDWLILQSLIGLLIIQYPTQDLHSYGTQLLIRSRSRVFWWISKCIWNFATVLMFYLLSFIIPIVFSAIFGDLSLIPNIKVNEFSSLIDLKDVQINFTFYISIFILPILTSVAVSLFQMMLSFLINPVISFLLIVGVMAASAYCHTPFLVGNYTMILRNKAIYESGFNNTNIIIIDLLIVILSVIVGLLYFKGTDILKKD